MIWYFICIFALGSLFTLVVTLASKNGSKAAQLEALKAELRKQAEEQARISRINNSVSNMSNNNVRNKLYGIANSVNKK